MVSVNLSYFNRTSLVNSEILVPVRLKIEKTVLFYMCLRTSGFLHTYKIASLSRVEAYAALYSPA